MLWLRLSSGPATALWMVGLLQIAGGTETASHFRHREGWPLRWFAFSFARWIGWTYINWHPSHSDHMVNYLCPLSRGQLVASLRNEDRVRLWSKPKGERDKSHSTILLRAGADRGALGWEGSGIICLGRLHVRKVVSHKSLKLLIFTVGSGWGSARALFTKVLYGSLIAVGSCARVTAYHRSCRDELIFSIDSIFLPSLLSTLRTSREAVDNSWMRIVRHAWPTNWIRNQEWCFQSDTLCISSRRAQFKTSFPLLSLSHLQLPNVNLWGILVGIIYDKYGSLHRAKCDAFGLLLTYWIGNPLLNFLVKAGFKEKRGCK